MNKDILQMAASKATMIFVYGTLKTGESRNVHLQSQRFIGTTRTLPDYRMYRVDEYPGLIEVAKGSGNSIEGELWLVDEQGLETLDAVEGVDQGYYERRVIRIAESTYSQIMVEAYFYLKPIGASPDCGTRW